MQQSKMNVHFYLALVEHLQSPSRIPKQQQQQQINNNNNKRYGGLY